MGRKKLEQAGPPGSVGRLQAEVLAADRFIAMVTWSCTAGMVLWSMLNATPYVQAHIDKSWKDTAFVLPLVVDLAFVGALRADEIASRYGVRGGPWAVALRLFTGASSVFLNIGNAWQHQDWTGVGQHLVAPGILVLLAEAGPVYRRKLAARLTAAEAERETKAEADRSRQAEEAEQRRRQEQEDADRKADRERAEADRLREQRHEDEARALELEDKREQARANRALEARRLDLEERRLTTPPAPAAVRVPEPALHGFADGTTAIRHDGTTASGVEPRHTTPAAPLSARQVAPQLPAGHQDHVPAPVAAETPQDAPASIPAGHVPPTAVAVAAAPPAPGRITARVEAIEDQEPVPEPLDVPVVRLDQDAARAVMRRCWQQKMGVRETAKYATRSPAQVSRVFQEFESAA